MHGAQANARRGGNRAHGVHLCTLPTLKGGYWKVFLTLFLFQQERYFTWAGFALGAPAPFPRGRTENYYSSIFGIRLYVLKGLLKNPTGFVSDCKRSVDGQRAASIPARISWKGSGGRISRAHFR